MNFFVFLSPSASQVSLDFCFQKVSSFDIISSYFFINDISSIYRSWSIPYLITVSFTLFNSSSIWDLVSKILPIFLQFHVMRDCLIIFNLHTKQNSLDPKTLYDSHHFSNMFIKFSSFSHLSSNLNGQFKGLLSSANISWIVKWSEPETGSMDALTKLLLRVPKLSLMKNLSYISTIILKPDLLLVQVKIPLSVSISLKLF